MTCPNCNSVLTAPVIDNQTVLLCLNCGAAFFEENGINRISLQSAKKLVNQVAFAGDADQSSPTSALNTLVCPKDQAILKPLRDEETIPATVNLFGCPDCHGVLAFPKDLINFKQAQLAKINYFKIWNKPLPALKAVLVMSVILFTLTGAIYQVSRYLQRYTYPSQASDLIKKIHFSRSGRYLFIYFTTTTPVQSKIIFYDKTENLTLEKTISSQPSTVHQLTTGDINLQNVIYYKIILTSDKQTLLNTQLQMLRLN